MRILLIAYEFPPIEAAQALRWAYLSRELLVHGHEVHVLTVGLPSLPKSSFCSDLSVHRTFAGPFVGGSSWLRARFRTSDRRSPGASQKRPSLIEHAYHRLRRMLDWLLFPDVRIEWLPFAARKARHLVLSNRFDLIISSHEPGVDLLLGLWLKRRFDLPLVCDLGDPVLAPYTPSWRRLLHLKLERSVSEAARSVLVTNAQTAALLTERHGIPESRFMILSQGFNAAAPETKVEACPSECMPLRLFFSGSLYRSLRSGAPVFKALASMDGVELILAGNLGEESLPDCNNILFLGQLSHAEVLRRQKCADVLLNIGNISTVQIPGKLFEYFGAARPILHVMGDSDDPCADLILALRRGLCVESDPERIRDALIKLKHLKSAGLLDSTFDLNPEAVAQYSWDELGRKLSCHLESLIWGVKSAA